jgi:LysM repeat protein
MSGIQSLSVASSNSNSINFNSQNYTVQRGDTLTEIASENGMSLDQLLALNPQIRNADMIFPGDKINIGQGASSYSVQSGDTLSGIAARFGVDQGALLRANPQIDNPDMIYVGDKINIPADASAPNTGGSSGNTGSVTPAPNPSAPPVSSGGNTPVADNGQFGDKSPLGQLIFRGESQGAGGYNAYNTGRAGDATRPRNLTDMTIGQIMREQSNGTLFAVGKYQVIPGTMREAVANLNINPNEKFTPALQERIFNDYLIDEKRPQIRDYVTGETNGASGLRSAQIAVAKEFASVATPVTGKSYYDGDSAGNHSSITAAESARALNTMRTQYQEYVRQGLSPDQAWRAISNGGAPASTGANAGANPSSADLPLPQAIKDGGYLNRGASGEDVRNLQRLLIANGASIKVTGNFDNATAAAVETFKNDPKHPLGTAAGQPQSAVGRTTWEKLNEFASPAAQAGTSGSNGVASTSGGRIPDTANMTQAQKFDVYAGYINEFGSSAAQNDLAAGRRVILGLRHDTPTSSNSGNGTYDDRIIVMWQDSSGKHVQEFRGNTEGSAQYDPTSRYFRRAGGDSDANNDGVYDVPRLADGTYGFRKDYWSNGGPVQSNGQNILSGTTNQTVQRDSNHDGVWDSRDPGRSDLSGQDFGIYFHRGGSNNTYSAGCQTLAQNDFNRFWSSLGSQSNFNYTLVNESRLPATGR